VRQIFAAADGVVAPIARAHWADTPPAADKPRPWPMSPQDLSDEALTAVHDGATPIYFRDRPQYYAHIARGISGWTGASMSAIRDLVREAQREVDGPRRSDRLTTSARPRLRPGNPAG
jgi:hypothetical protein